MVPGDQHYRSFGQCIPQTLKLAEREDDRGVGRANRVEEIAGYHDQIRCRGDHAVHGEPERARDIGLALVDARRRLAMVLPRPQVRVGEVSHFHTMECLAEGPLIKP